MVINLVAAGDRQQFNGLERAAVGDAAARVQLNLVRDNRAALQVAFIRLRQIQLRCQHGLPVDLDIFPPDQALAEVCDLIRRQADPQLQVHAFLRRGRVIQQRLHLFQIGAGAIQVTLPALFQHRLTDVAGIKLRIPEEAIIVVCIQIQFIQQIGRSQHPIGLCPL